MPEELVHVERTPDVDESLQSGPLQPRTRPPRTLYEATARTITGRAREDVSQFEKAAGPWSGCGGATDNRTRLRSDSRPTKANDRAPSGRVVRRSMESG